MSCWDCLKLFIPIYPTYQKPVHELEELVIVNNNNTTERTYLIESSLSFPRKRIGRSKSQIDTLDVEILNEDEEEIIYSRPIPNERKEQKVRIFEFENLSDTDIFGNQKLIKRRKKFRNLSNKFIENEDSSSSDDSWDDSLIIN